MATIEPAADTTILPSVVRPDLAPEIRAHVRNLMHIAVWMETEGIFVHPKRPAWTLERVEAQIAHYQGHTHESYGGRCCVHCGWPIGTTPPAAEEGQP